MKTSKRGFVIIFFLIVVSVGLSVHSFTLSDVWWRTQVSALGSELMGTAFGINLLLIFPKWFIETEKGDVN